MLAREDATGEATASSPIRPSIAGNLDRFVAMSDAVAGWSGRCSDLSRSADRMFEPTSSDLLVPCQLLPLGLGLPRSRLLAGIRADPL